MISNKPPAWTRPVSAVFAVLGIWAIAQKLSTIPEGYDYLSWNFFLTVVVPAYGVYLFGIYAILGRLTLSRPGTGDA